jgi:hypothetical protein
LYDGYLIWKRKKEKTTRGERGEERRREEVIFHHSLHFTSMRWRCVSIAAHVRYREG